MNIYRKYSNHLMTSIKEIKKLKSKITKISLLPIVGIALLPLNGLAGAPNTTGVKWHPGHYYIIKGSQKNNATYLSQVYKELESTSALKGMMIRYFWSDLEKEKGVYDFSSIDKRLAEVTAIGKRLVIQVQTKSFNKRQVVPTYMKTAEYGGGEFDISDFGTTVLSGRNTALWNLNVQNRLIALFKAMGARYNSHANFEAVGMIETAMGRPLIPITLEQESKFYTNMLKVQQQMRVFFPNTMTIQEVNYPRAILASFVSSLKNMGTALSGPDTFLEEPGLLFKATKYDPNKGIYNYYSDYATIMPMAPTVMPKNYENTKGNGTGYVPTITQIYNFAKDTLNANYIFWTREEHSTQLLQVLNSPAIKTSPTGGLRATCPSIYTSCVK